ncbi:MAG: hypothetical protein Q4C95_03350 [Planctomycetia bacterium]|nr:hypothetical protein [Planctomycetia bacterium]
MTLLREIRLKNQEETKDMTIEQRVEYDNRRAYEILKSWGMEYMIDYQDKKQDQEKELVEA